MLGVVGGAGVLNGSKTPNFVVKSVVLSVTGLAGLDPFFWSSLEWLKCN